MKERESPETYLGKCRRNIMAELWGLFETKVKPAYPAWRDKMDKVFFRARSVTDGEDNTCFRMTAGFQDDLHTKPVDMNDLRWSLVVWRNRLHLLLPRGDDGSLVFKTGRRIEDRFNTEKEGLGVIGLILLLRD